MRAHHENLMRPARDAPIPRENETPESKGTP
jgi:hypothetical protein